MSKIRICLAPNRPQVFVKVSDTVLKNPLIISMIDQNRWALGLMLGLLVSGGVSGGSFLIVFVIIVIFFLLIATSSIIHHKHLMILKLD